MSELLEAKKQEYLDAERTAADWSGFLNSAAGKRILGFFEDEYVATFDECDTVKAVAANAAKRGLIKKLFRLVTHDFRIRDNVARELHGMLVEDSELPEKL